MFRSPWFFGVCALLAGCSNDTFVPGDAGGDANVDGALEASADAAPPDAGPSTDAAEELAVDAAPLSFCQANPAHFFCDDFDDPLEQDPWSMWSPTPSASPGNSFTFVTGVDGGRAAAASAGTLATAYLTKQHQTNVLKILRFSLKIPSKVALTTFVRVTMPGSAFTLETDSLGGNLIARGDSGGTSTVSTVDAAWHAFAISFTGSTAQVAEDGSVKTSVSFAPQSPSDITVDFGIVAGAVGGKLVIDNVLFD